MTFPTSATSLVKIRQDSDGTVTENYVVPSSSPYTHQLGASLSPAQPTDWQLIPKGGFPIQPPGAPVGVASSETGGLTANGHYAWVLTNCTDYGETTIGTALTVSAIGTGITSYVLTLPSITQGTTDVPVRFRRLYRTTNGGSTYGLVTEVRDLATTTVTDRVSDADVGPAPPSTNTSGIPAVVSLAGSSTSWTEVAPGTSLTVAGQYIIDYSYGPTGGTITHAAADAGKSVAATYSAATLLSSSFENSLITAIKETGTATGSVISSAGQIASIATATFGYGTYTDPYPSETGAVKISGEMQADLTHTHQVFIENTPTSDSPLYVEAPLGNDRLTDLATFVPNGGNPSGINAKGAWYGPVAKASRQRLSTDEAMGVNAVWTTLTGHGIESVTVDATGLADYDIRFVCTLWNFGGGGNNDIMFRLLIDGSSSVFFGALSVGIGARGTYVGYQPASAATGAVPTSGTHTFALQYYNDGGNFTCRAQTQNQQEQAYLVIEPVV